MIFAYFVLPIIIGLLATSYALPLDADVQNTLFELGFIDLRQYGRSIFGEPDNRTGEVLARYNPETDGGNPEELGSYLEGDILMPLGQARNGLSATSARWPNGVIPYEIRGGFGKYTKLEFIHSTDLNTFLFVSNYRRLSNELDRAGF